MALQTKAIDQTSGVIVTPIVEKLQSTSKAYAKAKKVKFNAEEIKVPYESALTDATWLAEGENAIEANLNLANYAVLTQKRVGLAMSVTKQLELAAEGDLKTYCQDMLIRRVGKALEKSIMTGAASNEFKGIAPDATVSSGTVALTTTTIDDLKKVMGKVLAEYRVNSIWYMSPAYFDTVSLFKDAAGNTYVQYIVVRGKIVPTLFGCPIEITDSLAAGTTTGQVPAIFGSIADCYTIGVSKELDVVEIAGDGVNALRGACTFLAEFYGDGRVTNYQAVAKAVIA